jgi:hypothetical protein
MKLYLDSRTHKITNEKDEEVSLDNAKVFWFNVEVEDCSQSFERLANLDFDFDKLDEFYQDNP